MIVSSSSSSLLLPNTKQYAQGTDRQTQTSEGNDPKEEYDSVKKKQEPETEQSETNMKT